VETPGGETRECRIKGKVLQNAGDFYNPITCGDTVEYTETAGKCLVTGLAPRRNTFSRYNEKGKAVQLLAANIDAALCVTSGCEPPFRPRFIDRVLLQAEMAGIPLLIAANKNDLGYDGEAEKRLALFQRLGAQVYYVTAKKGDGLDALKAALAGKRVVVCGQSGVGKSTLVNALLPGAAQKTGCLNTKWDRGAHTTTMSTLLHGATFDLIDTPGLRQFIPLYTDPSGATDNTLDIAQYMNDIAPYTTSCHYGASCTHTHETGCAVLAAVDRGEIDADRYKSYLSMRESEPR
jgi:ribosome biogenesis GTPase